MMALLTMARFAKKEYNMKKLILVLIISMSSITFASLEGINDYEEEGPEVVIPRAIAGGASEIWSWVESIF